MSILYLDYNVVASSAGIPLQPDGAAECSAMLSLKAQGDRFALSAWTAFELARSQDALHIRQCCDFIEKLDPLWVGDARYIIDRETARFLVRRANHDTTSYLPAVRALHETIGQMWFTYGVHIAGAETFRTSVGELRSDPRYLQSIVGAAEDTPRAIVAARRAQAEGRETRLQPVVDRYTFAKRLSCGLRDERIDFLMTNQAQLYKESPTMLAIEDALSGVRAHDSFVPKISHAADFQHGLAALAYCDHFVTRDGQLAGPCRLVIRALVLPWQVP